MIRPAIRTILIAAVLLNLSAPRAGSAQDRGPSTAEERARAVKIAYALEADPLAPDAKKDRAWMVQWVVEIPDITVDVCPDYFDALPNPPQGHSSEIFSQMILSSVAFMIEHPDKAKDEQAVTLAGLLGSLKAYESVLKQDPSSRWPYVDKLIQMREQGKLDAYVAETLTKCKREEEEAPEPGTHRASL